MRRLSVLAFVLGLATAAVAQRTITLQRLWDVQVQILHRGGPQAPPTAWVRYGRLGDQNVPLGAGDQFDLYDEPDLDPRVQACIRQVYAAAIRRAHVREQVPEPPEE